MRNFKKFLALVLAMLMVSACAISVSAFADDAAVNASKFADAIKTLAKYEILVGDENGNVNPNKLVRRDEAAVMFAKLFAGADGQVIEWDSAKTTYYDDVDAEWSFGYINYVTDKELMQGVGEGKFAPTENITLAEVLTIAVNANEVAFNRYLDKADENPEPAKWYTNYMSAARKSGFTTKLGTSDYEAYATKGQVAQIVDNMMDADSSIENNFKVKNITGGTVRFTASTVSISGTDTSVTPAVPATLIFTTEAFATEAAKYGVPTDYKALAADGTELYIEYKRDSNNVPTVYKMAVSVSYNDVKVEVAPKEDNQYKDKIIIDGVTYATTAAAVGGNSTVVGGAAGLSVVTVNKIASGSTTPIRYYNGDLPNFFKAVAADTDANGVIDVVTLYEYEYGTIEKAEKQIEKDKAFVGAAIDNVIVRNSTGTKVLDNADDAIGEKLEGKSRTVAFAAASNKDFAYSDEKPVLYRYDIDTNTNEIVIDVWKVAEVVEGKLISYSDTNKNVTLEEKGAYGYLANVYTAPAVWTLNQNISFYAIDGKFAKLTGDAKDEALILVDSVAVKDGKAVISGIKFVEVMVKKAGVEVFDHYTAEAVTDFVVEGYTTTANASKLTKQDAFDYKIESPKTYGKVKLAEAANKPAIIDFEDGNVYTFVVTADKKNYVITDAATIKDLRTYAGTPASATFTGETVKVNDSYIYKAGVIWYEVNNIVIVTETNPTNNANSDGYKNYYGDVAYATATALAEKKNVTAYVVTDSDDKAVFMLTSAGTAVDTVLNTFEEGAQLVQVISEAIDVAYDYSTYSAIDLVSGKKVTVKGNGLALNNYYVVKDGTVAFKADENTATNQKWIAANTIKVVFNGGIRGEIKAQPTSLSKAAADGASWTTNLGTEKTYNFDQIVIYEVSGSQIALNDAKTAAKTIEINKSNLKISHLDGETGDRTLTNVLSYIVDGTMIVIGNPA